MEKLCLDRAGNSGISFPKDGSYLTYGEAINLVTVADHFSWHEGKYKVKLVMEKRRWFIQK